LGIGVKETTWASPAIDTPEDVAKALRFVWICWGTLTWKVESNPVRKRGHLHGIVRLFCSSVILSNFSGRGQFDFSIESNWFRFFLQSIKGLV
jgi:hypothetical protein